MKFETRTPHQNCLERTPYVQEKKVYSRPHSALQKENILKRA